MPNYRPFLPIDLYERAKMKETRMDEPMRSTKKRPAIQSLFFLLLMALGVFTPSTSFAQSILEVFDINTKEVESSFEDSGAAKISIYFSARQAKGQPISGLKADNINLLINKDEPPLKSKTLRSFKDGDRAIAVVVVFPIAKDYIEEFYGIRSNVASFVQQFRSLDWVGVVAYDSTATPYAPVTGADIPGLADTVREIQNTEVIEPNLFGALIPAVNMLKNLEAKQKYLVVVSNAEGAIVGDDKEATKRIQKFQYSIKELGITPMIVGYTPDGPEELTYRKWLKQLALAGGTYNEAVAMDELPNAMNTVFDLIFQQYILDAEVDLSGDFWLEEGKYTFTVVAKVGSQELKGSQKAGWPALSKDNSWLIWMIAGIAGGLLFLVLFIVIIIKALKRRKQRVQEAPMMMMSEQPQQQQDFKCETCGKTIPEKLYGFRGEFCMSGGKPDCPYYQMPDNGRLTITRGPLADVTFFIKEEMVTIGSLIDNSVALVDNSVSKKHAAIKVDDANRYEIRDFGSTNGTYVNNDRVQRMFLKDGDVIKFGSVEMTFTLK